MGMGDQREILILIFLFFLLFQVRFIRIDDTRVTKHMVSNLTSPVVYNLSMYYPYKLDEIQTSLTILEMGCR